MKFKKTAAVTALAMIISLLPRVDGKLDAVAASEVAEGTYLIRNANSGAYIDVTNGVAGNSTNVQQWGADCGASYNVWRIDSLDNGYYRIYSALGDANTYALNAGSSPNASDDNICIYQYTETDSQLFEFSANSDGSFKILTKISSGTKAVEVADASTANGANIQQWEVNGASCQNWELIPINYVNLNSLSETQCQISGGIDYTPGDLNGDGKINIIDSVYLKRNIINTANLENAQIIADLNGDAGVSAADVQLLMKYLMRQNVSFVKNTSEEIRVYQAIDGLYTDGISETKNSGFVSEAYLNLDNAAGIDASYNIYAESDGVYSVKIRFANGGTAARNMTAFLNNEIVYWTYSFPLTGAWTEWSEAVLYLPLKSGVNRLTLVSLSSDGAPNIDTITVLSAENPQSASTPIAPIVGVPSAEDVGRQMENLNRGVVAANTGSGMLIAWRSLATDPENTSFILYKNGSQIAQISSDAATNYFVSGATSADVFTLDTYVNGVCTEYANSATVLGNKNTNAGAYMDIPISIPADQTMPDGTTCSYTANDCSVGDVDGDGEYEIILKWNPSNAQDNSTDGYTGTVFLDCYKLDGTQLWRIDLGINIRAGAHYTQFIVYDLDGDSKAELMCKTADGTYDGLGNCIGSSTADYRTSAGRILSGNEYLTLFDGLTGEALDTVDYQPGRGTVSSWGDSYGNRCDRFLAGVAYFNGVTPSAFFCRGYYTRTAIAAYDIVDKKIVTRWIFDTGNDSSNPYYGQGNHNLVVCDADSDGFDEIAYGSCTIDHDGTGLNSTGLKHGDMMQAGDLIPSRDGLEIYSVHEETYGASLRDAATGEIIYRWSGTSDTGRGICANLTADIPGMEFTSTVDSVLYDYQGNSVGAWSDFTKWGMNSLVWFDGDLEREALDRTMVDKYGTGRIFTGDGVTYNNGSKSNACITCDLFGDWREEMIFATSDSKALRIFTTTYTTDIKLFTLMHDSQYRTAVAAENVGYNLVPNTSFFLGTGYDLPETPKIYTP